MNRLTLPIAQNLADVYVTESIIKVIKYIHVHNEEESGSC
jgi:hypothetical protein